MSPEIFAPRFSISLYLTCETQTLKGTGNTLTCTQKAVGDADTLCFGSWLGLGTRPAQL